MLTPNSFMTRTLACHPRGESVARILYSAIQAVEPGETVRRFVHRDGKSLRIDGHEYSLKKDGQIILFGLGKAARAMALPLVDILADFSPRGLLIPKKDFLESIPGFDIIPGGHPIPDENSLRAGQRTIEFLQDLSTNDLLICLISGGGSALMSAPQQGISLPILRDLTSALLACGAQINEVNTVRRHLDRLKGGGLARFASPAQVVSLILSDVVDSPLEAIASGPTAPDPSTRMDALAVLEKYGLRNNAPAAIRKALETGSETIKPGDRLFERVQNVIVGSNLLAAESALGQARSEGFKSRLLGNDWQGEAGKVAHELCDLLKNSPEERPFCMIAGGETTVTLHGRGRGGRNQELALAAVNELAGQSGVMLVSLATDGEDGPTDAGGAVVTGETLQRGRANGLYPETFLGDNDAYSYFSALEDLLRPGPTGTNVNDLTLLFGF